MLKAVRFSNLLAFSPSHLLDFFSAGYAPVKGQSGRFHTTTMALAGFASRERKLWFISDSK